MRPELEACERWCAAGRPVIRRYHCRDNACVPAQGRAKALTCLELRDNGYMNQSGYAQKTPCFTCLEGELVVTLANRK